MSKRTLELVKVIVQPVFTVRENGKVTGEIAGQSIVFADKWPDYYPQAFADDVDKWTAELNGAA